MRYAETAGSVQAPIHHARRWVSPVLASCLMISLVASAIAAPAQPRIRIHVSTTNRASGQAVLGLLTKNNVGRPELKTVKPPPKSDELFYKEGRDDLAARIAALLGLRPLLSKELAKTDVAIYLSDAYRLPAATGKDGQPPAASLGHDSAAAPGDRFTRVLSGLDYSAEVFGLLQAFTSYALKKQDADAMTSLRTGELGGGVSIMVLRTRYAIGLQSEYVRASFPDGGPDGRLDIAPLARLIHPAAGFNLLGQIRLGVSALDPFGGDGDYGAAGAVGLGGTTPVPTVDKAHIVALAEYHVATYPKTGYDWMVAHGLSIKIGAGLRF